MWVMDEHGAVDRPLAVIIIHTLVVGLARTYGMAPALGTECTTWHRLKGWVCCKISNKEAAAYVTEPDLG